jgi:RHS repeat-associated protein
MRPDSFMRNAGAPLRTLLALAVLSLLPLIVLATAPQWWIDRGVINPAATPNDYAAINQGQLKNLAVQAYQELQADLPASAWTNGPGTNLTALMHSFSTTNNYLLVNQGQLKNLAKQFYDFLIINGYATNYPWAGNTNPPAYGAIANIGQAKNLFAFDPSTFSDTDKNGLPDAWELYYFGHIGNDPNALAPDGDGLTIGQAYQQGVDPVHLASYAISLSTGSGPYVAPAAVTLVANTSTATAPIKRVDFYQGNSLLGSIGQSPFQYALTNLPAGNYPVSAISFDTNGLSATANAAFRVGLTVVTPPSNVYTLGAGNYKLSIFALDGEQGIQLQPMGNNASLFPTNTPWFMQIAKTTRYHLTAVNTNGTPTPIYGLTFENPVVAFGSMGGGSPLYVNHSYSFAVNAPLLSEAIYIQAFQKSDFTNGATNINRVAYFDIGLPVLGTPAWDDFEKNGYVQDIHLNQMVNGKTIDLDTIIQYIPSDILLYNRNQSSVAASWVITQKSASSDFVFKVAYSTYYYYNSETFFGAISSPQNTGVPDWDGAYTLDFDQRPAGVSDYLLQPHFQGTPLPSSYTGKSVAELINEAPPIADTLTVPGVNLLNLDNSPELRSHPLLDQFVASMNNDPIALANYVINEIGLTDAVDGSSSTAISINEGGVSRSALATFTEGQGSPAEQCALLVYLLRKAGVSCGYVYPQQNGTLMFNEQMSTLLHMQLNGALNAAQDASLPTLIPVNYPWVAAYIGGKWVHIFPWLKDTAANEGYNLFDYMPTGYQTGEQWALKYAYIDPAIRSLNSGTDDVAILLPQFINTTLAANYPNLDISQMGVTFTNRKHYYSSWDQFPRPWQTPAISNSNLLENLNQITNIFDTVTISVVSDHNANGIADSGEPVLAQTGPLRMVDLHDRRLLLYHKKTGTNLHQMILALDAYRPSATGQGAFTNDTDLLNRQVLTASLTGADDWLLFQYTINQHRQLTATASFEGEIVPVYYGSGPIPGSRTLRKGDMAAFCMSYGTVSSRMQEVHAEKYWAYQQQIGNGTVDPELALGEPLYLMGLSYFYKTASFNQTVETLTKMHMLTDVEEGLFELKPVRNADGTLPNNGDLNLQYPLVDIASDRLAITAYFSIHPELLTEPVNQMVGAAALEGIEASALEHLVINQFFQQTGAVSTIKLLELAQGSTPSSNVVTLNWSNYPTAGAISYTFNGQTQTLANWFGGGATNSTWSTIVKEVNRQAGSSGGVVDPYFVTALLTAGPISAPAQHYSGIAAMILGGDGYYELIGNNMMHNGGIGDANDYFADIDDLQPSFVTDMDLYQAPDGGYVFDSSGLTPTLDTNIIPADSSVQDSVDAITSLDNSTASLSPDAVQLLDQLLAILTGTSYSGQTTGTAAANGELTLINAGYPGQTSDYRNMDTSSSTSSIWGNIKTAFSNGVTEPVNAITGEFYVDAVDLRLNGPMPLEVRRNYGSQNLADNNFGYGWRMAYFPYLTVSTDASQSLIYAAEMDGSVVAYRRQTPTGTRWTPTAADNPQLANMTSGGSGSTSNVFNNRIDLSTSGGSTTYTLTGSDGGVRTFLVQSFPVTGSSVTRQRPYLQKWTDHSGNFYTFSFGTDATAVNYGQLTRIASSNGDYIGFDYDTDTHVLDAYTGDGRWLYYQYDNYGDLIQVTLPDGSTIAYTYEHLANTGGLTGSYSDHLILQETKPNGRIVQNIYDANRRVVAQSATVGTGAAPIQNATFAYANAVNADQTLSGTTTVTDVNGHPTVYTYAESQITNVTDALGRQTSQQWYQPGDTSTGAYPRSLKSKTDARGLVATYQYDANGNLLTMHVTGNLTGGTSNAETATTTMTYNGQNLVTQVTDPLGNSTLYTYGDSAHPYLPTSIEKRTPAGSVSTTQLQYEDVSSGTNGGYGLLKQQVVAAGTSDSATTTFTHDAHGFLTSQVQATGTQDPNVTTTYTYNLAGQLTSATDAAGQSTVYAYDELGNRIWTENYDASGNFVAWQYNYYNQNGELEWTEGPRYSPDDYVYREYDRAGRPSQEIKWRSQAASDGSGVQAVPGNALYATTFFVHDAFGNLTEVDDPNGNATTMNYDAMGQMLGRQVHSGAAGAAVLSSEAFTYEPGGEIATHTNPLGGVEQRTYTYAGRLATDLKPDGSSSAIRYDLMERPVQQTLANGSIWYIAYDDLNRVVTRTLKNAGGTTLMSESEAFDRRGNSIAKTDGEGNTFHATYDGLSRLKTSYGPAAAGASAQRNITRTYDAVGQRLVVTDGLGQQTATYFDSLKRPTKVLVRNTDGTYVGSTGYWYSLDFQSVTITHGSGSGAVVETDYTDTYGHPVLVKHADGTFRISQYDANGNPTSVTDENGVVTTTAYDALNHPVTQRLPSTSGSDVAVLSYTYDAAGDLLQRQMPGGLVQTSTYDNAGRKLSEQLAGGSATSRHYTYAYNGIGQLQTISDPRGFTTTLAYDDFLRLSSSTSSGGSAPEQNQATTYAYDRRNLVTQLSQGYTQAGTGSATVVNRAYDAYGQVAQESISVDGTQASLWNQAWDSAGRRTSLQWGMTPQGAGAGNHYTYQYNAKNQLIGAVAGSESCTFLYGGNEMLSARNASFYNNVLTYDARGRTLTNSYEVTSNNTTPYGETLSWRPDSRLNDNNINRTGAPTSAKKRQFTYDARGRVLLDYSAIDQVNDEAYQFDGNTQGGLGVRTLAQVNAQNSYQVTSQNGLQQPTQDTLHPNSSSGEAITWLYDAAGNVTTRTLATGVAQTLTWDGLGRLVKVQQRDGSNNGYNWTALYDGLGRRLQTVQQPVTGGTASGSPLTLGSFFDPQVEFLELGVAINGARTWKVYGPGLNGTYAAQQGLGSLQAVIDEQGGTVTSLFNDAFGNVQALAGAGISWSTASFGGYGVLPGSTAPAIDTSHSLAQALLWRGRYIDGTGFYNLGARTYDPQSGRFLSADPLGHASSLSLYDFANGDPINQFDPDGRFGKGWNAGGTGQITAGDPNSVAFNLGTWGGSALHGGLEGLANGGGGMMDTLSLGYIQGAFGSDPSSGEYTFGQYAGGGAGVSGILATGGAILEANPGLYVAATQTVYNPWVYGAGTALAGGTVAGTLEQEATGGIGATGQIGESWLANNVGGESQVLIQTSQGARYIDQLSNGVAYESKVGYTSLTQSVQTQISKDVELIGAGEVNGAEWHFFTSPVTGVGGPSGPLATALNKAGIPYIIH